MLTIVFFIFFVLAAARIIALVRRESAIFQEFGQSRSLAILALLLPLGMIVLFALQSAPLLAVVVGLACYLPPLLVARRMNLAFERAGTDRVKRAHKAASQTFGAALVGVIYVGGVFLYVVIISVLNR